MSIWTAATDHLGRRQCKRCGKMFTPRSKDDQYGSTCAQKVRGSVIECRDEKGEVTAVII